MINIVCVRKSFFIIVLSLVATTMLNGLNAQAPQPSADSLQSFMDTSGSYGFMYLSANCFECNPKGLVFYKKFIIISGFYKTKDFYSTAATRSVDHFRDKF